MVRFYLRFTGRVQGVGFRFFVAMNAERCHLTGWVKNMSDGSVTAEVQGTRVEIEKFLNLIQTGNRFIRVFASCGTMISIRFLAVSSISAQCS